MTNCFYAFSRHSRQWESILSVNSLSYTGCWYVTPDPGQLLCGALFLSLNTISLTKSSVRASAFFSMPDNPDLYIFFFTVPRVDTTVALWVLIFQSRTVSPLRSLIIFMHTFIYFTYFVIYLLILFRSFLTIRASPPRHNVN